MKITIETIPHKEQRYETCGDWFYDPNGDLVIKVSDLGDWRKEALIAVHELVEVLLCKHKGPPQEQVDTFDLTYEASRSSGNQEEPGDDPSSPYKRQHCLATGVERILAAELEVDWKEYEDQINTL